MGWINDLARRFRELSKQSGGAPSASDGRAGSGKAGELPSHDGFKTPTQGPDPESREDSPDDRPKRPFAAHARSRGFLPPGTAGIERATPKPQRTGRKSGKWFGGKAPREAVTPSVIGIDFGTSSTKVVYRQLGSEQSWTLPAIQPDRSFPWFCTPTTFQVQEGAAWFGTPTENLAQSLKLNLLDSSGPPGHFGLVERTAIAYLGFIMESSIALVCEHLDVERISPRFNIGIPMSFLSSSEECTARLAKYMEVAKAAVATTSSFGGVGIEQAMDEAEVSLAVDRGIAEASPVDCVWILPESIASLVSLSTDPAMEERAYSVIDIGAGTTDVTSSHFRTSRTGRHRIACYHDSTEGHGAIAMEQALGSEGEREAAIEPIWRQWVTSWDTAKRKDRLNPHLLHSWCHTTVLFAGGGGQHPSVQPYFTDKRKGFCPIAQSFGEDTNLVMMTYRPSKQVLGSLGRQVDEREAFQMLAVAHGLSFMQREWPLFFKPDDVGQALSAEEYQPSPTPWV